MDAALKNRERRPHHGQQWAPRPAGYMRSDRNGGTRPWGQVTPEGPPTTEPAMSNEAFWREQWNADSLPANLPRVAAGSPDIRNPSQRIYEALGSNTNPLQFTLLQDSVNRIKGAIESYSSPMDKKKFENYVNDALDSANSETERDTSIQSFMAPLRETRGVFQYLNADDVITRVDRTIEAVHSQLQLIELHIPEARGLSAHWNQFYMHYFEQVSEFARNWMTARIDWAIEQYEANPDAYNQEKVLKELKDLKSKIPDMKYPYED